MTSDSIPEDAWRRLDEMIERNHTFTLTTHVNPDGDALGSELAMYSFLTDRGKDVKIINNNDTPEYYSFLKGIDHLCLPYSSAYDEWISSCDAIFVLDISTLDRLGGMEKSVRNSPAAKICIDHHPGNAVFADLGLIRVSASATAEIIFELYNRLGGVMTRDTAEALYVAILTDTESFSNQHTGSRSHEVAAALLQFGLEPARIYRLIYKNYSWQRFSLFQKFLRTLTKECGGRLVWAKVDGRMVEKSGARREEMDGFVDFPMSVADVEMSIFFLEVPGRGTKVSIRSREEVDSNALAMEFGGGGHRHAAGIRMYDVWLDDAVSLVLTRARMLFNGT